MDRPERRRGGRAWLSWALFAIAAVLFAAVAVLYVRDRQDDQPIPTPPQVAGRNEMINVKQAFEAEGLEATFAPGGARSEALSEAGQVLKVDGATAYVFVYPDAATRESESSALNLGASPLLDVRGTPIVGGPPRMLAGSNILVMLMDADDVLAAKVEAALSELP